tara:strand:- start:362 stop:748 length:387 start_codon:yes stop_codon:yes gene_type:complete
MINQKVLPVGIWNENKQIAETKKQFDNKYGYEVLNCTMPPYSDACKSQMNNLVSKQELFGADQIYTINTPNPADDFIDNFIPQTLPTFGNLKNESFIKPLPFFKTEEKPNLLIPTLLGIALIGYFILK